MIIHDFYCEQCEIEFEDLVERGVASAPCPECGALSGRIMSAPRVGLYNDPAARSAALRKRSHDHTMRELAKEPEKHGFLAARKQRWNIRRER